MDNRKIGIFDSGIGGINVLNEFLKHFPNEDFIYLADMKNLPYGTKSHEELVSIVTKNINFLYNMDLKVIVIACNTASANSYHLELDIPIFRIIEPTAKMANKLGKDVAILATNYTIDSKAYEKFLTVNSRGFRCSDFVSLIENPICSKDDIKTSVSSVLKDLKGKEEVVILGCTHFQFIEDEITSFLGNVIIIDSCKALTDELKGFLKLHPANNLGRIDVIVTGNKEININLFHKKISTIKYLE